MYETPTKKETAAFEKSANAYLMEVGSLAESSHRPYYAIATIAGELRVTVYEDWLACRFEDVARAQEEVISGSLNSWSGKWNWHGLDTLPAFQSALMKILAVEYTTIITV